MKVKTLLPSVRETRWARMNSYWRTTLRCPNGTALRKGVTEQRPDKPPCAAERSEK